MTGGETSPAHQHQSADNIGDGGNKSEVRGVGMIQALQLTVPGKLVLEGAMADGLLFNITQDNVVRLLPPFLLEEKHVDAGMKILKRHLAAAQKAAKKKEVVVSG